MRWTGPDGYWASDERELIDVELVYGWISRETYWAEGRRRDVMVTAIERSLAFGVYAADGTQVGFARYVTDQATFAWLCDVFVDSAHRGHGLGSFLVETATAHPAVRDVRQVLAAAPERSLYRRVGFAPLGEGADRWMELPGSNGK